MTLTILPPKTLQSKNRFLSLRHPLLVGILNLTHQSFSGDGLAHDPAQALEHARQMILQGADWIDIGAESTNPEAQAVSLEEELRQLLPLVEALRQESNIWISVDTYKAEVARQVLAAGADAINDVTALRGDPQMVDVLAETQAPVVLMYSKDPTPRTTKTSKQYTHLMETLEVFFQERLQMLQSRGVLLENVILDPGMGFFVSGLPQYSFEIIRRLPELAQWGFPILVGPSRKSFLAKVSPGKTLQPHEREVPTATVTGMAVWQGASLLRLHDVAQGRLVLDTMQALKRNGSEEED